MSPSERDRCGPRTSGTMQKVHALSHPIPTATQAWWLDPRWAGRALGKISVYSRNVHLRAVAFGLADEVDQAGHGMRADHHVHPRGLGLDDPLVLLGQAAGHHDAQPRVGQLQRLEVAQGAVQAPVGVLPDGAGVEHDDLGIRGLLRGRVAVRLQEAGDAFGVSARSSGIRTCG